jgi:hypothetical protein
MVQHIMLALFFPNIATACCMKLCNVQQGLYMSRFKLWFKELTTDQDLPIKPLKTKYMVGSKK